MTQNQLRETFTSRIAHFSAQHEVLSQKHKRFGLIRITLFVSAIVGLVYLANIRELGWIIAEFVVFVPAFGLLIKRHNRVKFDMNHTSHLILINQDEILRLDGQLHNLKNGQEYFDGNHAYAPDLDIFGYNSLFQLIVRSNLKGSESLFAKWALQGADHGIIVDRQKAIAELQDDLDWRQHLTAFGMHLEEGKKSNQDFISTLTHWLGANVRFIDNKIWMVLNYLLPVIALVTLCGTGMDLWTYHWVYLSVAINIAVLSRIFQPLMSLTREFDNLDHLLKGYEKLIVAIEDRKFESCLLQEQQARLIDQNQKASTAIRSLRTILNGLENRSNWLYMLFNLLFVPDLFWLRQALKWNAKHKDRLAGWFDALYHIDVLNDMASYAYANPTYTTPELSDQMGISTQNMGHPLIKPGQRIVNDYELKGEGKLALVTGSNMSGKSTFLRTVGVNFVLAQMGAPVCADRFTFSRMRVFTSMRTQDNLEENVSSFYAELKRIRQLLNSLDGQTPVYYMLDEILKGTNSEDRNTGAISLIEQLTGQHAIGMISTHDLQLSELSSANSKIENYSFNSIIEGDEIIFDYKLTPGPCRSFNASKLMEKMGIIKK